MKNNETLDFGFRLKELREKHDIKQGRFAEIIGVSRQAINAYESNKYLPDTVTILKMADYFKCSTDYLYGRTEHENYETQIEFDESLSVLSKSLCAIKKEYRNIWLDIFVGTAQWIENDLNNTTLFHHSCAVFFNAFISLVNCCFSAKEKQHKKLYTAKIARKYRHQCFQLMSILRTELNNIDVISNESVEPMIGESTKGDE